MNILFFRQKERACFSAERYAALCMLVLLLILEGCGKGTDQGSEARNEEQSLNAALQSNSFTTTMDEYGLQKPNFYYRA